MYIRQYMDFLTKSRQNTARDTIRRALEASDRTSRVFRASESGSCLSRARLHPMENHHDDKTTGESKVKFKIISLLRSA